MSTVARLTVAAACAVALASAALVPVFQDLGWLLSTLGAVVAVAAASAGARRIGLPRLLQPLAGMLGLLAYVCLTYAGSTLAYGVLPGGETLRVLRETIGVGLLEVEALAPPVPTSTGLVLLAVLGVGGIAVLVDTLGATMRQPAIAGLPLLLLFAVPAAVLPDGLGWWPFALGAAGWLGLLLVDGSDAVSRWGTPLRGGGRSAGVDPGLGRVGRRIGAAALGVAVIVPAMVPGLDSRLLGGGNGDGGSGGGGTTRTFDPLLQLVGQLRQPDPPGRLLRYTTDDPQPDYLRMTTLDLYSDRTGWSSSGLSGNPKRDRVQDGIPTPPASSRLVGRTVTTEIDVATLGGHWLPAPMTPTDVEVDGRWLWDEQAQTIFSKPNRLEDLRRPYTVQSRRVDPTPEQLRASVGTPSGISEVYAEPPVITDTVRALIDRTVADATTDYDKVAAIQALFRDRSNGFRYTETTAAPSFTSPDALQTFLEARRGFCEQYASAMAAMVRSLGIPARVAVGFTSGTKQSDGTYLVTTSDAHAWPEVWFNGAGWVRFEPTPQRDDADVTVPGYTTPPVETPDAETPATTPTTAPAPQASAAPADPNAVDRADDLTPAAQGGTDRGRGGAALEVLGWALLAAALLSLPALLAAARRRRRWATPGPLAAWGQVCDDAVDVGHTWRPADSPRAAAAHLADARSLPAEAALALHRLAVAAERARYARPGSSGGADTATLHDDVRQVRTALLAGATGEQRWVARLAPPSTLRWASAGLGAAMADLLDRFDSLVSGANARLRSVGWLRRRPAA